MPRIDADERAGLHIGQRGRRNEDEPRLRRDQDGPLITTASPQREARAVGGDAFDRRPHRRGRRVLSKSKGRRERQQSDERKPNWRHGVTGGWGDRASGGTESRAAADSGASHLRVASGQHLTNASRIDGRRTPQLGESRRETRRRAGMLGAERFSQIASARSQSGRDPPEGRPSNEGGNL